MKRKQLVLCMIIITSFLGCAPYPISTLQTSRIEDGAFKIGSEMLNPQINTFVKDSTNSHIEFFKSSCIILEASGGKEASITWPITTKFRYGGGFSWYLLYPHPIGSEPFGYLWAGQHLDGREQSLVNSLIEDILHNIRINVKLQYKHITLCYSMGIPFFLIPNFYSSSFSIILAPESENKIFTPYFASAFSFGSLGSNNRGGVLKGSLGAELSFKENFKLLGEVSYIHFSSYKNLVINSSSPIFGIATTYVFPK